MYARRKDLSATRGIKNGLRFSARLFYGSASTLMLKRHPQLGHVTDFLFDVLSNSSDTSQPKAMAIFSNVSAVGFPFLIVRDTELSLFPSFSANCFAVTPFSFNSSLMRNILLL